MISLGTVINICTNKNVYELFKDYENHRDYFFEGTKEEYIEGIRIYADKKIKETIEIPDFVMEEYFFPHVFEIYKDYLKDNKDIIYDPLFKTLTDYINFEKICAIENEGPCDFEHKDLRKFALGLAKSQPLYIFDFIESMDYENKVKEAFKKFDKYTNDSKKSMSEKDFEEFTKLCDNCGIYIDQKYVDLYFKSIIKDKKKPSYNATYNIARSMISNLALSHDCSCLFNIKSDLFSDGIYHSGIITVSEELFNQFNKNPKKYSQRFFETIFHEYRHLLQDEGFKKERSYSYSEIKMLEDDLLHKSLNSKFGKRNYMNLSYELDAREFSRIAMRRYLGRLGVKIPRSQIEYVNKYDRKTNGRDTRLVDTKMVPVDHLFDEFIKNIMYIQASDFAIDIFEEYPILKTMYDETGRRYTTLELLKRKEELVRTLFDDDVDKKQIEIHNIDEIVNNRGLSFVNLVADYKELVADETLEMSKEEKENLLNSMYERINSKSKSNYRDLVYFANNTLDTKLKDISNEIKTTIKTGAEMAQIFKEMLTEKKAEEVPLLKK